ncbi:MAG TPA: helix-turn-helix domain-containing protein [Thermoanaerobaculia bacterium]
MDLVLKLREVRRRAGLTQAEAAAKAGIGVKSISSFESGVRIDSLKLSQLQRLLTAYGITLAEFFSPALDHAIAPWDTSPAAAAVDEVTRHLGSLPPAQQIAIAERFLAMLDAIEAVLPPHTVRRADGLRTFIQ